MLLLLTACGPDPNSISVSYLYPSTVSTAAPTGDLPEYAAQEVTLPYVDPNLKSTLGVADFDVYYDLLTNDTEREIYRAVVSAMVEFARKTVPVEVGEEITSERAGDIFDQVLTDYPQFFECAFRYKTEIEDGKLSFSINYGSDSLQTLRDGRAAFYKRANELIAQASAIASEDERQLFLYETVMQADYDFAELNFIGTNFTAHTAKGCLIDRLTVCDGYSKAFCLLANYSGIRSAVLTGYLNGSLYHAWIAVERDGSWLFCDPTMDDAERRYAGSDGKPYAEPPNKDGMTALPDARLHTYYNLTRAEIEWDHQEDDPNWINVIGGKVYVETPVSMSWHEQNMVEFGDLEGLEARLDKLLPQAKSGDIIEFRLAYSKGRSKVMDLIKKHLDEFALASNGANTTFALYVY
ncbi:MAG: hypothetical protein IJC25_07090 [Clostridia bacterium]|nr:hypothetical protein [Clostridia bacterium]